MSRRGPLLSCVLLLCALVFVPAALAQAPPDSDFEVTTLAKGADKTGEPIAMAVLPDRRVLHTSRDGRVWLTTPTAQTSLAGTIPVYSHDEDGLQGIAIDADFATNRWVYVYYSPPLNTPAGDAPTTGSGPAAFEPFKGHNLLSRMKLTEAGTLDRATEQEILEVPTDRGICCHNGGEIDFDAQGNLYLSTGDDTNPFESDGYTPIDERSTRNPAFDGQRSSANTNDLRGKLLRIKVGADGSYSVPAGNLFAPGEMGTRPEIYAMGFRNPFRFAVDPATGWVYLGDYGPDSGGPSPTRGPGGQVEFNLIKAPGNYGWPFCTGKNDAYNDFDFGTGTSGAKFDCNAPKNTSPRNTGKVDLPPAQPAWIAYDGCNVPEFGCGSESPMGGETYHFDAANPSTTKFPAYFDGRNFGYEFGRAWFRTFEVGEDGTLLGIESFMDSFDFKQLINAEFGPDGSLYVLDYGTGSFSGDANSAVYRVDYVQGTRRPIAEATADKTSGPAPLEVKLSSEGSRDPDGGPISYAWDFDGDGQTDSTEANPTHTYAQPGKYTAALTVTDSSGDTGNASVNIVAGNTAPTVTLNVPPFGGVYEYGDTITYSITVTDVEDGAIDCSKVRMDTALGHNEHTHGDQSRTGCTGQITIPAAWEDKTQHSYYLMQASYTDEGGATPGLELTGTAKVDLEHHVQQAEFFDAQVGTQNVSNGGAAGGVRVGYIQAGDWLRFDDIDLSGVDSLAARVTSTGASGVQFRADSPTGPLVATVNVPNTGGVDNYRDLPAVPVTDPGGTHDLYAVFTAANMDLDEFTLNGNGVAGNAAPVLEATATPVTGSLPLAVDFSATATDPEGTPVTLAWDFGVAGAPKPTTPTASYTYTQRGSYLASVTATDGDGRKSVRTFPIEVLASCGSTLTDQFDGSALGAGWNRTIREQASGYRVRNGSLEIDAVAGDMYGGNTAARNIIARDAPDGTWTATTEVTLDHVGEYEQAALFLHTSDANFLKLAFIQTPNGRNVEFIRQRNSTPDDQQAADRSPFFAPDASDRLFLRLRNDGTAVTAFYSADGSTWSPVGRSQPLDGLVDPVIGLSAFNGVGTTASFNQFTLTEEAAKSPDDEFDGTALDDCRWTTIVREDRAGYRLEGGKLEIDAADGDMYGGSVNAKNLILQPAPAGGWEATTKVALPQGEEYEQAGLIVHAGDANFAKAVLIDVPNQGWRIEFGQTVGGQPVFDEALDRSGALPANANDGVHLKLSSDGAWLSAAWSMDGQSWTALGRARSMSTLAGAKVGLAAFNGNGQSAAFDHFALDEVDVEPSCQEPGTPAAGYELLFDGTQASLDQWKMAGPGGFALQPDCSILSFGGLGLLWHPDTFDAYSLKLDWKMAGDDNAGVFVGFPDPGSDPFNAVNQGHEIQIDATDDPSHTTGSIYGFQAADAAARDAALKPPGQWNAYELVVQGDRIQVFLNGTKINDYVDTDPARMNAPSHIGLQNHGTGDDVFFRDVQIKEIDGPGTAPALDVTAPANGTVVNGASVAVTGTTDGARVEVRAGGSTQTVTPSGGAFSATVPVALGSNTITVTAYSAQDVPTGRTVTVVSRGFGTRVGGLTDPAGDDNGPGTYVYPTNGAFNDGAFDLEAMDVYTAGDQVRFVTRIAGDVRNPFGGDQISVQRVNVYLGAGGGDRVAALPGTNMDTTSPWSAVVVVDGRFDTAGVYGPDGAKRSGGTLTAIPQSREIVITVPRSALGDLDLGAARYGTAMLSNGESGEGVGFVRPVYSLAYWENPPASMPWIKEYRFGGGAGEWENTADKDTDVSDPNALDVIVGDDQTQAQVMTWQGGARAFVPMLPLASAGAPQVQAFADPGEGTAPLEVNFSATALDPDGGRIVEYRWTFPDGEAFGQSVTRTFGEAGTHRVTVKVTDDEGESTTKELTVTVAGRANTAPEIVQALVNRDAGPAPLETQFEATARDADGDALQYRWAFGDGGTAIGNEADHTYLAPGTYEATVTVTDGKGGTDTATIDITVTDPPGNRAPTVEAAAVPASGKAPLEVQFTAEGIDPDGDALAYEWNFGDGSAAVAGRRALHTYTANGTYTATVTATDADGASATDTISVVVGDQAGNQPPTVQAAADRTTGTGPLTVNLSAAGFDPEGDPFTYVWDFGDGGQAGGPRVTHTYATPGTYIAKVTVRDAQGRSGEATVTITVTARQQIAGGPSPAAKTVFRSVGTRSLTAFRKRGLKVAATCGSDAPRAATVRTTKAAARKLGLRSRSLGRATVRCAAGKTLTLRLKPSRAARKALRTAKPKALRVTVALVLGDGGRVERTLRLT